MAESTTTRLGLHLWGADSDTVDRTEFETSLTQLEALTAIYLEGTRAARPAPGTTGRFYKVKGDTALLNGTQYYDDGVAWTVVGGNVEDAVLRASAAGTIPVVAKGAAGQTANLQEWRDSADAVLASIDKTGKGTFASLAVSGSAALGAALSVVGLLTASGGITTTSIQTSADVTASRVRSTATRADGGYKTEIKADGTGRFDGLIPVGTVAMTLAAAAPAGWQLLDGSNLSRTTYADLFALIGTAYGAGDGSTTFGVPNMRGRVPVMLDGQAGETDFNVLGKALGARTVNLSHQHYTDHTHNVADHKHDLSISTNCSLGGSSIRDNAGTTGFVVGGMPPTGTMNGRQYTDAALGVTSLLQPYFTLNFMVKV